MQLGDLKLVRVSDGGFWLDGGAMFGVVPKPLWQRKKPADEINRIQMATNCLLVERGDDLLLIDTGLGDGHDDKFHEIFGLDPDAVRLPESIRRAGYDVGDVTHVLLTHLHFDHSGWNTRQQGDKRVPTFPKARYWLERGEVEHARQPSQRDRASYHARNWQPLFDAGVVELFEQRAEPMAGVEAIAVRGHNANMCIVRLDGGDEQSQGIFWADLIPTTAHIAYPWIMGYDLYPLETLDNKQQWIPRAAEGAWLCLFEHDWEQPWGRIVEQQPGRFQFQPVAES